MFEKIHSFAVLSRPHNSVGPVLLLCIGAILSDAQLYLLVISAILAIFIHSAVTILNDVEDIDVDAANKSFSGLHRKEISPKTAQVICYVVLLVSIGISLVVLPLSTSLLLVLLVGLSWAYNTKPLQISRKPIASIFLMGVCYGFIPFAIGASLGLELSIGTILLLGVFFGFIRSSLSILKDYKDAVGDAKHHKKTFLLVYGRTSVRRVSVVLAVLGYAGLIAVIEFLVNGPLYVALIVLLSAGWLIYERTKLRPSLSYEKLNQKFHDLLKLQLLFDGLIIVWLIISLA